MGWEIRNGHRYYYRKRWEDGRCVSEYVGNGPAALFAEQSAQLEAGLRELQQIEQAPVLRLDEQLKDAYRFTRMLEALVLLASGCYQHKGQWRKRRTMPKTALITTESRGVRDAHLVSGDIDYERLAELRKRVNRAKPDSEALLELRVLLSEHPDLWRCGGDMQREAENTLLSYATVGAANQEYVRAGLRAKEKALGFDEASPLEQMLIRQIVLEATHMDKALDSYLVLIGKNHTIENGRWRLNRLESAQRRYLRAVEALAKVQKLSKRAVLVNIAQNQQVNVTPAYAAEEGSNTH
ncbi:MAG: hypothetical protein AAGJ10_10150 [Bacteroidota bacterium]